MKKKLSSENETINASQVAMAHQLKMRLHASHVAIIRQLKIRLYMLAMLPWSIK